MSSTREEILAPVHIRGAEAAWVLSAHTYALLVPVVFVFAVYRYWDYLVGVTYNPFLFFVAAALFSAGSAFEVGQNTLDNWYLTSDTASANGFGLCDFLFYWLITAGQAVSAVAIGGDKPWVLALAAASVVALPLLYFNNGPYVVALSFANLLAIGLAFRTFGDPVVFLQLLGVAATVYFFQALLKTGAQVLHGFTTLTASSGVWFLIWAIANGAARQSNSWLLMGGVVLAALVGGVALWPYVSGLPVSRRRAVIVGT